MRCLQWPTCLLGVSVRNRVTLRNRLPTCCVSYCGAWGAVPGPRSLTHPWPPAYLPIQHAHQSYLLTNPQELLCGVERQVLPQHLWLRERREGAHQGAGRRLRQAHVQRRWPAAGVAGVGVWVWEEVGGKGCGGESDGAYQGTGRRLCQAHVQRGRFAAGAAGMCVGLQQRWVERGRKHLCWYLGS